MSKFSHLSVDDSSLWVPSSDPPLSYRCTPPAVTGHLPLGVPRPLTFNMFQPELLFFPQLHLRPPPVVPVSTSGTTIYPVST